MTMVSMFSGTLSGEKRLARMGFTLTLFPGHRDSQRYRVAKTKTNIIVQCGKRSRMGASGDMKGSRCSIGGIRENSIVSEFVSVCCCELCVC